MTVSTTTAVIYQPNEHGPEYIVFVEDLNEFKQWKEDKSVALARFLGPFTIFKSGTSGHTGQLGAISQQEIESAFFDDNKNIKDKSIEAAIEIILKNGTIQKSDMAHSYKLTKNPAQGSGDVRGTGADRGSHR